MHLVIINRMFYLIQCSPDFGASPLEVYKDFNSVTYLNKTKKWKFQTNQPKIVPPDCQGFDNHTHFFLF